VSSEIITVIVTKSPTCSSILEPNQVEFRKYGEPDSLRNTRASVLEEVEIDTITLDDFCSREGIVPDFVKIDTQGSELEILE
jgi:FkbM family methyltransferase